VGVAGWPRYGAASRRAASRVNAISAPAWGASLVAGVLGLWACVVLLRLISRFVPPSAAGPAAGIAEIPPLTLIAMSLMGAAVAGVVEEIAFRGYMQQPLESRYGPVAAIGVVGIVFGLAHASHSYWSLAMMPYYMAVAGVYGALAYLTNSVLPSLALHAGGDAIDALLSLATGSGPAENAGRQAAGGTAAGAVLVNVLVLAAVSAAALWAFYSLAETIEQEHVSRADRR
jgi:membrane protease YdiL (CAAX protease family)